MSDFSNSKYNEVVVFSGGGTRFAIYCGMYAALEDLGHKPDLIIGACGGAIATGVINSFSTNTDRRRYLESEELYRFTRSTQLTGEKKLYKIGLLCLNKILNKKKAPYIEDVFNRYLVEMDEDVSIQLPSLETESGKNVNSVIIGARILFDKAETGSKRAGKKLYRKVLLTDNDIAQNIHPDDIGIQSADYLSGAVDPTVEIITNVPMQTAMRISLSDMFYVRPVCYNGCFFAGGAIDLTPVELARSMGKSVVFERKNPYSVMEEALVRAVLGYSGNERLKAVESAGADKWIDTQDATNVLNGHYCKKSIDWGKLQVSISLPGSYRQYVKDMGVLWDYGYERVIKGFIV